MSAILSTCAMNSVQRFDHQRAVQAERTGDMQKAMINQLLKEKEELTAELSTVKEALVQAEVKAQKGGLSAGQKVLRQLTDTRRELYAVQQEKEALKQQLHFLEQERTASAPLRPVAFPMANAIVDGSRKPPHSSRPGSARLPNVTGRSMKATSALQNLHVELSLTQAELQRSQNAREEMTVRLKQYQGEVASLQAKLNWSRANETSALEDLQMELDRTRSEVLKLRSENQELKADMNLLPVKKVLASIKKSKLKSAVQAISGASVFSKIATMSKAKADVHVQQLADESHAAGQLKAQFQVHDHGHRDNIDHDHGHGQDTKMTLSSQDREMMHQLFRGLKKKFATPDGQIDWDKAFDTLDSTAGGNQFLSKAEFLNGLNLLGIGGYAMKAKKRLHTLIDCDCSGIITRHEWAVLQYYHHTLFTEEGEKLRAAKAELLNKEEVFGDKDLNLVYRFVEHLKVYWHRISESPESSAGPMDFEDVFFEIDTSGNGLISQDEFLKFLQKIGLLSLSTATSGCSMSPSSPNAANLEYQEGRRLYRFLDKDKGGSISRHEFKLLEYYLDCKARLVKKNAERERIEAERERIRKEEEEARAERRRLHVMEREMISEKTQDLVQKIEDMPAEHFCEEMIMLVDMGWIELAELGPTLTKTEAGLKFIVAVDGSDPAITAIHLCQDFWLSRFQSSQMSVVHIENPFTELPPRYRAEFVEEQCESWMKFSLPPDRWKMHPVSEERSPDHIKRTLTKVVHEEKGQFLFVGCFGAGRQPDHETPGLGSTALYLLSHAGIPVMLVPEHAEMPTALEPCHHVVCVVNDQSSFKAFVDCVRLAGPDDSVEVVHIAASYLQYHEDAVSLSDQALKQKYERLFSDVASNPGSTHADSLPGMLGREGPWPTFTFTALRPSDKGYAATVAKYVKQVRANFAYMGLDAYLAHSTDFEQRMKCPTLVSHFSDPGHIETHHGRHIKQLEKIKKAQSAKSDSSRNSPNNALGKSRDAAAVGKDGLSSINLDLEAAVQSLSFYSLA